MKHISPWIAVSAITLPFSATAATMSYEQLETCAGYAQRMRSESPTLVAQDRSNAQLRNHYNAGNGTQDEKIAFNRRMERYRQDVVALNRVRQAFAEQCAGHSVRQSDVDRLPEPTRSA